MVEISRAVVVELLFFFKEIFLLSKIHKTTCALTIFPTGFTNNLFHKKSTNSTGTTKVLSLLLDSLSITTNDCKKNGNLNQT